MTSFRHIKRNTWDIVTPVNTGKGEVEDIDRIGVTLELKVTIHLQTGHFVEILIFRLMYRSKHGLSSQKNIQKYLILTEKWRF